MILVKGRFDYADEFDVEFVNIVTEEFWGTFNICLSSISYPFECYFGTNEFLIFDDAKQILRGVEAIKITKEEAKLFKEKIGKSFGTCSHLLESVIDHAKEDEVVK